MRTTLVLFVLSLALIGVSLSLKPFHTAPDGSYPMFAVHEGDSQAYSRKREQALTAKFCLQDYGITLLFCSLVLAAYRWRPFKAPRSLFGFSALAVTASLLSAGALVFDLFQGQARWEFPPWADSLGVPLMGVPVLLIAGLAWAFGHFTLLAGVQRRFGVPLSLEAIWRGHRWLLIVSVLTALLTIGMGAEGAYWYVIPSAIWLCFYASIAAVRYKQNDG